MVSQQSRKFKTRPWVTLFFLLILLCYAAENALTKKDLHHMEQQKEKKQGHKSKGQKRPFRFGTFSKIELTEIMLLC